MKTIVATTILGFLVASKADGALPPAVTALIDSAVDPCEDFYQYSCGSWLKKTTIPEGIDRVRYADDSLSNDAQETINNVIASKPPMIGELFSSCMDTSEAAGKINFKPVQDALARIQKATSKGELAALAGEFGTQGTWLFTNLNFVFNGLNPKLNGIAAQPSLSPLSQVTNDSIAATTTYIVTAFKLAGVQMPADTNAFAKSIIDISNIVNSLIPTDEEAQAVEYLQYKDALVRFPIAFKAMVTGAGVATKGSLKSSTNVFFNTLKYFEQIEKQIWNVKSLEQIKHYFMLIHINQFASYLGPDFNANEVAYSGQDDLEARCQRVVFLLLEGLLNEYYFKKALGPPGQQFVQRIVDTIKHSMSGTVRKQSWLTAPARAEAKKKLERLEILVGKQSAAVTLPFTLKAESIVSNFKTIVRYKFSQGIDTVDKPIDRSLWTGSPGTVEPSFTPSLNTILLPTATLQPPLVGSGLHPAQNYGGLGTTIGGLILNGFDTQGVMLNSNGDAKPIFSKVDGQAFDKRVQCLRDQYSQYTVRGENGKLLGRVDGNATVDSNIGDNGGVAIAYQGLQKFLSRNPNASKDMSSDEISQLFFLAAGQQLCTKSTDADMLNRLQSDSNAPPAVRVNGFVSNSPDFAEAFQCKSGSKMNPAKKCLVW